MFDVSPSRQDNYLCTNRDIGLSWRNYPHYCNSNLKYVYTPDYVNASWSDNALCLPLESKMELISPPCGLLPPMSCVHLFDSSKTAALNDNFVCWKEHAN
ncbi:unnamed protein product [Rotaria socialis]|uniref:Uncharacterized protein n=1 Tax=Rotaria socialis TaxID=392032 RepID=A0A817UVN3_9BILA|nr:unnamed protein product [Rotaria socialis]CAF3446096.1 unnamed protein product [Rotaria socialis]CAF3533648.1 unnamed protein product [Rotaria socialis]CAF4279859.1 unnamed protein product [Rotaria socialis]CAF4526479.1 unnamed protein product [Rotaria socialis]